jgi:hypothetical protein
MTSDSRPFAPQPIDMAALSLAGLIPVLAAPLLLVLTWQLEVEVLAPLAKAVAVVLLVGWWLAILVPPAAIALAVSILWRPVVSGRLRALAVSGIVLSLGWVALIAVAIAAISQING